MSSSNVRVMIIDDSALMRNLISNILKDVENIEVVGTALNGIFGLNKLNKLNPDIIILDLEMPVMDGIEFLKRRNKNGIKTPVIILSALAQKGAKITLDALSLGASDFILKPSSMEHSLVEFRAKLIEMICALAKPDSYVKKEISKKKSLINYITGQNYQGQEKIEVNNYLQPVNSIPDIDIVCIGISTGGPIALRKILPVFPENFPVPIVIVQHMPPGFTYEFALSLNNICALKVKEAQNDDIVTSGRIYIAPGDKHIKFIKKKLATVISLDNGPLVNGHKPSVDVLFKSAAESYGKNCLACIMTGMGKDGAENIGLILKMGGMSIAQNQDTCTVFGMPKIAIERSNIQIVKPLDEIPQAIIDIVMNKKI